MEMCPRARPRSRHEVVLFFFLFLPQWCKAPSSHLRLAGCRCWASSSLLLSSAECEPTSGVKRPENWDKKVHVGQRQRRPRCGSLLPVPRQGRKFMGTTTSTFCCSYVDIREKKRAGSELKPSASVAHFDSPESQRGNRISGHLD